MENVILKLNLPINLSSLFASDPFDCSAASCGGESWIISNNQYKSYILTLFGEPTCDDAAKTPFLTAINPLLCKCPAPSLISPCLCSLTTPTGSTLTISCLGTSLNDTRAAAIVNNLDSTLPIDTIDLSVNNVTKIPEGISKFQSLADLRVNNNSLTAIGSADGLNLLKANVTNLDLSNNLIERIDNASFPSKKSQINSQFDDFN